MLCFTVIQCPTGAVFHGDATSNRCRTSRWCNVPLLLCFTMIHCPAGAVLYCATMSNRCWVFVFLFFCLFFDGDVLLHRCHVSRWYSVPQLLFFTVIQCPVGAQQMLFLTVMQGLTVAVFDCDAMSSSWCVSLWCNAMVYGDAMSNRRTVLTTAALCQQPYALGGPCALLGYPQSLLSNICLPVTLPACVSA